MKLRISASLCTITALGALLAGGIAAQPSKPPEKKSAPTKAQMQKAFPNASGDVQGRIKAGIEEAIATDPGFGNACFHPVHGLRVSDGNQSVDLLVCFACSRLLVFSGQAKSFTTIGGSLDTGMLLNHVLREDIQ